MFLDVAVAAKVNAYFTVNVNEYANVHAHVHVPCEKYSVSCDTAVC